MSGPTVRFDRDVSDAYTIRAHLEACARDFVPPLDGRVAIPAYAGKLAAHAERFEAWRGPDLVGLVAIYWPREVDGAAAFISNVSVTPAFTRRGIAHRLMADCIAAATGKADRITLAVNHRAPALTLYASLGFTEISRDGDTLTLGLALS